jgi:DNA-binding transcriptional regulator YdaS (Cro superfamily)
MAELINRTSNTSNKVGTISTASLASNAASINRVENGGTTEVICDKLKPDLPLEVHKWIEYNDISSANLRSN